MSFSVSMNGKLAVDGLAITENTDGSFTLDGVEFGQHSAQSHGVIEVIATDDDGISDKIAAIPVQGPVNGSDIPGDGAYEVMKLVAAQVDGTDAYEAQVES